MLWIYHTSARSAARIAFTVWARGSFDNIGVSNLINILKMEKFIQAEISKLIKQYNRTKDPLVLAELKQFVDHIPNLLTV